MTEPVAPFGPEYPRELGVTVAKFRRKASKGLNKLTADERRAYGNAVHAAFVARNRKVKGLEPVSPAPNCASGTAYSDGRDIHEAVRRQQASALLAYPAAVRRARTDKQWRDMYESAMREKRAAAQCAVIVLATRRHKRRAN